MITEMFIDSEKSLFGEKRKKNPLGTICLYDMMVDRYSY